MGIIKWRLQYYLSYLQFRIKWDATYKGLKIVPDTVSTQYLLIVINIVFCVACGILHNGNINYSDGQKIGNVFSVKRVSEKMLDGKWSSSLCIWPEMRLGIFWSF